MNRRARRRAARHISRRPVRSRRPLPLFARLALLAVGAALVVFAVVLAAQGASSRGGRVIGALALAGILLMVVAWLGRL